MIRKCDVLVAMSQTALDKHLKDLKENGTLLIDEDLVREVPKIRARVFKIPATKKAETELKSKIYANVVMLGALTNTTGIVSQQAVEKAITESVPNKTQENNIRGFRIGLELVKQ